MRKRFQPPGILPGFWPSFSYTVLYLTLLVLIPLSGVFLKAVSVGWTHFWKSVTGPNVVAAYKLSFGASLAAGLISVVIGFLIAWVLVRYDFPGKSIADALVDLPFALPTAVAGIALSALYAPHGWFGAPLAVLGIKIAYTQSGILVALIFVGFPFVVRTLEPIIGELEVELEEASATLGASRLQTLRRVLLPQLVPAILTGAALAFARGVGEYGSVIFIGGNLAYVSEIAPLMIVFKLEEYNYDGATAVAAIMLVISFVMLFVINSTQAWSRRRIGLV